MIPPETPRIFQYTGASMQPTLKPGQIIYVRPQVQDIQRGDVIVYRQSHGYVVHRVRDLKDDLLITRGDNNPQEDQQLVHPDQIVGVAVHVDQNGSFRKIHGGWMAFWRANLRWKTRAWYQNLLPLIGAPYRWLKARRWVGRVWKPKVTQVRLVTQEGEVVKYLVSGKVVATWNPATARFTYRHPYDLVIFQPTQGE